MSSHIELRQGQAEIIKRLDAQQAQASSKRDSEASLQSSYSPYPPNTANVYSPSTDWPFAPGFPFNQVSSPYHSPTPPPQPMVNYGDSQNSGNIVVTNVVNSNNDFSNNVYHYSQDNPRPRPGVYTRSCTLTFAHDPLFLGPTWKHYH